MIQTHVRSGMALSNMSREERIATLRRQMEALSPAVAETATQQVSVLSLPGVLGEVLPGGGLQRGAISTCVNLPMLAVEVIAHISASDGMVGLIGWPELNLSAVAAQGGQLSRIVVVPNPEPLGLEAIAILAEGLDLVVYRGAVGTLPPTQARPLQAKVRSSNAAVLMVDSVVSQPAAHIDAHITGYRGIGEGTGRIRAVDLQVVVRHKAGRHEAALTIGEPRQLRLV